MSQLLNFYADNTHLLLSKTWSHIWISLLGLAIGLVLALPLGIYLGHKHRAAWLALNLSNGFRALPSLALIAMSIAIFGISQINIQIALVVLAIPPVLTNAYTAVDQVDPDAVDAARGMGMREREVLLQVELPMSWPLIFAGVRTAAVFVIATAPLAALAGGGTLGDIIVNQATYHMAGVIAATIVVVALAFLADGLLGLVQRAVTPKGLVLPKEIHSIVPPTEQQVEVAA
jgi:osmoprotectant transport system permease protein